MAGINIAGKVKSGSTNVNIEISRERATLDAGDRIRLILMLLGLASIYFTRIVVEDIVAKKTQALQNESQALTNEIGKKNARIRELQNIRVEAERFDQVMADVRKKLNLAESVSRDRNFLVRAVDFVVQQMPNKVWMKSIGVDMTQQKTLQIEGAALQMQTVSDFLFQLQPGSFFTNWELEETQSQSVAPPSTGETPRGPVEYKNFRIRATVSEP